jgi:hypothetical protein
MPPGRSTEDVRATITSAALRELNSAHALVEALPRGA